MQALLVVAVMIIIFLTAVSYVRFGNYVAQHANFWRPRAGLAQLSEELRPGDLIFFASTVRSPVSSAATQQYYSHVGVVVADEKERLYISETQSGGHDLCPGVPLSPGACVLPLLTRLVFYTGITYAARLRRPLTKEMSALLWQRAKAASSPYPSYASMLLGVLGIARPYPHCFQHAAMLLKNIASVPRGGVASVVGVCSLPGGPIYDESVQIVDDISPQAQL